MDQDTAARLERIEEKLDRVLAFADLVETAVAPYLKGKSAKYYLLYAQKKAERP
jgi:hypothetical protein